MSAFMVSQDHIDALVDVVIHGPSGSAARWDSPNWAAHDPRTTDWQEQVWRSVATGGMAELVKSDSEITGSQLGEMLWTENERSVEARYPSDHAEMLSVDYCLGYEYRGSHGARQAPTVVEAFKLISCLEYQSCEHEGWQDSEAYRCLMALQHALIHCLPGYSAAPWEWSTPKVEA